jgi:hypothetical protein
MHLRPWNYLRLHQDEDPGLSRHLHGRHAPSYPPYIHRDASPTPHLDTHSKELLLMQADAEIEQRRGSSASIVACGWRHSPLEIREHRQVFDPALRELLRRGQFIRRSRTYIPRSCPLYILNPHRRQHAERISRQRQPREVVRGRQPRCRRQVRPVDKDRILYDAFACASL